MAAYYCPRCKGEVSDDKYKKQLMCPKCGFQLSIYKIDKSVKHRKLMKRIKPFIVTAVVFIVIFIGLSFLSHLCRIGSIGEDGGIIFFDKMFYSNGWRYLEVAPENLEPTEWMETEKNEAVGEFTDGLGYGARNTYNMIYRYGQKSAAYKAVCYGQSDDWFLGNKKEMKILYYITKSWYFKHKTKAVENFNYLQEKYENPKEEFLDKVELADKSNKDDTQSEESQEKVLLYWTSVLKDGEKAYCINFEDGQEVEVEYAQKCLVRPIRKF